MSNYNTSLFNETIPYNTLPTEFQQCIECSKLGNCNSSCDSIVGSLYSGPYNLQNPNYNLCASPQYYNSGFCACVNSPVGCPTISNYQCSSNPNSYIPIKYATNTPAAQSCQGAKLCTNNSNTSGSNNASDLIIQNCSDNSPSPTTLTGMHIIYFISFLIILIGVIYVFINKAVNDELKNRSNVLLAQT